MRRFLREFNCGDTTTVLTVEEASFIVYCAHPSQEGRNAEFDELIESLQSFSSPEVGD